MTYQEMIQYALDENFADAAIVDTDQIVFNPSFRDCCAENICGQYGANHSCPPGCSSPEEMKQKILAHRKALVLQSIWEIADYSDWSIIKPRMPIMLPNCDWQNAFRIKAVQGFW